MPLSAEELLPLVYEELRRLAAYRMANEAPNQTLRRPGPQPTALLHEAWLRLGGEAQPQWQNRGHFFAAAGEAMRRILIDRARKRAVRRAAGLAVQSPACTRSRINVMSLMPDVIKPFLRDNA